MLRVHGARENNLKSVDVTFPLGTLVDTRTLPGEHDGVDGIEHVHKVVNIDQSPIGRNSRSNPATYIGFYDNIRDLFTAAPLSVERGYKAGRFSFNVKGGRCEECQGEGAITTKLYFMPDVEVTKLDDPWPEVERQLNYPVSLTGWSISARAEGVTICADAFAVGDTLRAQCRPAAYLPIWWWRPRLQLFPENFQVPRHRFDPAVEIRQVEFLVGCVEVVVGKPEPHHDAGDAEVSVEHAHYRNRPAGADVHGVFPERLLQRRGCRVNVRIVGVGQRRCAGTDQLQLRRDAFRARRFHRGPGLLDRLVEALVAHQACADLGHRAGRNYSLGALARETAADAVNLQRGARPRAFEHRDPFSSEKVLPTIPIISIFAARWSSVRTARSVTMSRSPIPLSAITA